MYQSSALFGEATLLLVLLSYEIKITCSYTPQKLANYTLVVLQANR